MDSHPRPQPPSAIPPLPKKGSAAAKRCARKAAATRLGIPFEDYERRRAAGDRWCSFHRSWEPESTFGPGQFSCRAAVAEKSRRDHASRMAAARAGAPVEKRACARRVPARDGDVKQAQKRIECLVAAGRLPHPNRVPCWLCGHVAEGKPKEHGYFHHKGYAAEHHEDVIVLCAGCRRSMQREPERPPRPAPPSCADVRAAQQYVNRLVRNGVLPRPDTLPCARCGHPPDGTRRHGYRLRRGPAHPEDVEVLCASCRSTAQHERRRRTRETGQTHQ